MKEIMVAGNLVGDAVLNEINDKRSVINFTVAVNESYTDNKGEKQHTVDFFDCAWWKDKNKTAVAKYLVKGSMVIVKGDPSIRVYEKGGEWKGQMKITASYVKLCSARRDGDSEQNEH